MPDYSRTVIYKLCCKDPSITDIYIGHTTDFRKRKCQHKCYCHNEKDKSYNVYVYRYIREHGGWDNWDMIEVCRQSCIDANDARKLERKYLEELGATLNMDVPSRTEKEYKYDNRDKIKVYNKKYYEKKSDKIKEKSKKYSEENRDKINEYYKNYREEHTENMKDYSKKYYLTQKEIKIARERLFDID